MKTPRDLSGYELSRKLQKLGYEISRQEGSHIRLTKEYTEGEHHLTIPNHNPVKIGTLNNILNDLAKKMKISKEEVIKRLIE